MLKGNGHDVEDEKKNITTLFQSNLILHGLLGRVVFLFLTDVFSEGLIDAQVSAGR